MNIKATFEALFNPQQISIAKILAANGDGSYTAMTQSGHPLVLTGNAQEGALVFYDMRTGTITAQAPDIDMTDIAV